MSRRRSIPREYADETTDSGNEMVDMRQARIKKIDAKRRRNISSLRRSIEHDLRIARDDNTSQEDADMYLARAENSQYQIDLQENDMGTDPAESWGNMKVNKSRTRKPATRTRVRVQSPSRNAGRSSGLGFSMPRDPRTGRFVSTRYY